MLRSKRGSIFKLLDELLQRKTIRSFAECLEGLDNLPSAERAAFEPFIDPLDPPVLILFAPAQTVSPGWERKGWHLSWDVTPNQFLILTTSCLLISSSPYWPEQGTDAATPVVTCISLGDILYFESGFILLIAWLECVWVHEGRLERTRICFNTVSRSWFEDLCNRMRVALAALNGCSFDAASQNLEQIASFPYKFRSLIPRHLLLAGERIQGAVFLPSYWERCGGIRWRHVAPRRALLRTSAHLILCAEELAPGKEAHGLIAYFLPLARVRNVEQHVSRGILELEIRVEVKGVSCNLNMPFENPQQVSLNMLLENKEGCL